MHSVRLLAGLLGRSLLLLALSCLVLAGCRSEEATAPPKIAERPPIRTETPPAPEPVAAPPPSTSTEASNPAVAPPPERVEASDPQQRRPLVAIIIDDMGYNRQIGRQLLQFEARFSFSFLPHAPFTNELTQLARQSGHDILVHLPMEPKEKKWRLEPETLLVTDNPDQIRRKIEEMVAMVPQANGGNTHMGSRFSEDGARMRVVLETLKAHSLFFIDSVTSPDSQGLATARRLHLPSARRHLFLDNDQDAAAICRQLDQLVDLARRQGQAIGIGHPHQAMLTALGQCGKEALAAVELVGVHRLVQ